MQVRHFSARNLLLKESTQGELRSLGVRQVGFDPQGAMPPLPQAFSIRDEQTPVEDQGQQGSCSAFCVVAALEHMYRRDLSEGQVNHEAEQAYGDCTEGLALVHAYQLCKAAGAVGESFWPYDDTRTCWPNPPNLAGASRHRFNDIGYVYQRPRPALHAALGKAPASMSAAAAPGLPLSLAIQQQLFSRRKLVSASVPVVWSAWPWDGEIRMPTATEVLDLLSRATPSGIAGWHCIAICGWDNGRGRFLFKNSWGPWGDRGYGSIPYQYIEQYSDIAMVGW